MPGLPTPPGLPAIPPPPNLPPVPQIPPVPNLPSLPVPPICDLVIPNPLVGLALQAPVLPAITLCKFIPPLPPIFIPGLKFPDFAIPGFPPKIPPLPKLPAKGILCLLVNPLVVTCGVSFGGGRSSQQDVDPDTL